MASAHLVGVVEGTRPSYSREVVRIISEEADHAIDAVPGVVDIGQLPHHIAGPGNEGLIRLWH